MSDDQSRSSSYRVQFESADVRFKSTQNSMDSSTTEGELDEETIRWGVLITRIICIVLVCVIIASVVFGETSSSHPEVLLLAALCACVLVAVFMCSFVDLEAFRSRRKWTGKFFRASSVSTPAGTSINQTRECSDQI